MLVTVMRKAVGISRAVYYREFATYWKYTNIENIIPNTATTYFIRFIHWLSTLIRQV